MPAITSRYSLHGTTVLLSDDLGIVGMAEAMKSNVHDFQ